MPRISRPATHTGDDGTTSTAEGERVAKDAPLIRAYGALDELNSAIGVALSIETLAPELVGPLRSVQNNLFHLGAECSTSSDTQISSSKPRIEERHIDELDEMIDSIYNELGPLKNFTLPGGAPSAAILHLARAVCRRAERDLVTLSISEKNGLLGIKYLNRLSDALFLMARSENNRHGVDEAVWDSYG